MALDPQLVGSVYILAGITSLAFLQAPLTRRQQPGSREFAVIIVAIAVWSICAGASNFVADPDFSLLLFKIVLLTTNVVSVGWFLLAIAFTSRSVDTRRVLAPLLGFVLLAQLVIWTNPLHHAVFAPGTEMIGTIVVPEYNVGFWIHAGIDYLLILSGLGLLVTEITRSTGIRRRQAVFLAIAIIPPLLANVVSLFDVVFAPYDLTPIGYVLGEFFLAWALFSGRFLEIAPVARRTVVGEMDDVVITLDDQNRVVDCNGAARDLFDISQKYVGMDVREFLAPAGPTVLDRIEDATAVETEVGITIDGETRHFTLSVSPVETDRQDGRVVVLRDVTARKRREEALASREQDLDLLRQILTRILRHNIRNGLSRINGNAELIVHEAGDPHRERAEAIVDASEELADLGRKARRIEKIVDREERTIEYDLRAVASRAIEDVRKRFPDVTYELTDGESPVVEGGIGLEAAVMNLVENAAEHNDAEDPWVRVEVGITDGETRVTVSDNGPGIPDPEIAVLEQHEETPLEHGSGIGLWLVNWVAQNMDATLDFETGSAGTTVTVSFDHQDYSPDSSPEPESQAAPLRPHGDG